MPLDTPSDTSATNSLNRASSMHSDHTSQTTRHLPPHVSDSLIDNKSRIEKLSDIGTTNAERIKMGSNYKTQSASRGPAGLTSKWKSNVDPLKPQPIRSYALLLFILGISKRNWIPFLMVI